MTPLTIDEGASATEINVITITNSDGDSDSDVDKRHPQCDREVGSAVQRQHRHQVGVNDHRHLHAQHRLRRHRLLHLHRLGRATDPALTDTGTVTVKVTPTVTGSAVTGSAVAELRRERHGVGGDLHRRWEPEPHLDSVGNRPRQIQHRLQQRGPELQGTARLRGSGRQHLPAHGGGVRRRRNRHAGRHRHRHRRSSRDRPAGGDG